MRILSCHQGPGELEGLPHLDEDPVHHQNQPQEPHILEVAEETEWEDGLVA